MDFATRQFCYNRLNPEEVLKPDNPLNFDLDKESDGEARGGMWVDALFRKIALCGSGALGQRERLFFTGLPGSGKTTELLRLKDRLEREGNCLVAFVDAYEHLNLHDELNVFDVISLATYAVERAVLEAEGRSPDDAGRQDSFLARFWRLLNTEGELSKVEASVSGFKFFVSLKDDKTLRERVHLTISSSFSRFKKEASDTLKLLDDRAKTAGKSGGVVVIVDSLEKIHGYDNHDKVIESAVRIFGLGAPDLRLPVHAIFTVPAELYTRTHVEAKFFPMIKIRTRNDQPYPEGLQAAKQLVFKRIEQAHLASLFGPQWEEKLVKLINHSGGYLRDILRMLREAVAAANDVLSERAFARILNDCADRYRSLVTRADFDWLAKVACHKTLLLDDPEYRTIAGRMLYNDVVLKYQNDESWFDLHPAIMDTPGLKQRIEHVRSEQPSACA